ncbi:MAG: 50S ribosomal protein L3 [Planctomycetes bacterium]|nr:50S ribosomal protein L3 [Planctomycetota bacterium]
MAAAPPTHTKQIAQSSAVHTRPANILYGTKVGMTRVFDGDVVVPVTVIQVLPNEVVEVKTAGKHGHDAIKVAVGPKKRKPNKALAGEYKKADVAPRRFLREIPVDGSESDLKKAGAKRTVAMLDLAKLVDVSGLIKGRGFAGVVKRHNFGGHKMTHGAMGHRTPGSIGCRMDPGRVWKGKRMAGHWGNEQVTVKNLKIVSIDAEQHLVVLRGAVPGPTGGLIAIKQAS